VTNDEKVISYYIEGPDKIKLDRQATYILKPDNTELEVRWRLEDIPSDNEFIPATLLV